MITETKSIWQSRWQEKLADHVSDLNELLAQLGLSPSDLGLREEAARDFPLRVPKDYIGRMEPGDPNDPLLKQILPSHDETLHFPGFTQDPVGDEAASPIPGLIHKYHGRVLLTVSGSCAVHCRYCFRRYFPYDDHNLGRAGWDDVLNYIADDTSIEEVIYSGGDPLIASDATLLALTKQLADIPHLKRLRLHTRLPVVIPERITEGLVTLLRETRLEPIMVLHCNHPNEIDDAVKQAVFYLRAAMIPVLNQAVLLKGVNDDVGTLTGLSKTLFDAGILPYYLNCLDKVAGAQHFDVDETTALGLHADLLKQLPGYLVPKLVREVRGALSKVPVV